MLVGKIQSQLQRQYDLSIPYQVMEFVSHDEQLAQYLLHQENSTGADVVDSLHGAETERVFIQQSKDTLEFTLYLDETVLASVCDSVQPTGSNTSGHPKPTLENLCTVMEGVSHAVCLLWHAHYDRQIRPVDLELQAEIDKYLLLLDTGNFSDNGLDLHQHLFSDCQYLSAPGSELRTRYQRANDSASDYCRWLARQFIDCFDIAGLNRELARFYRLSGNAKFDRIRHLH